MMYMHENKKRPFPDNNEDTMDSLEAMVFQKAFYEATDEILDGDEIYDDREQEFKRGQRD